MRRACDRFCTRRLHRPAGRSSSCTSCRFLSATGLYPLPRASSVPTPRNSHSAPARVRGGAFRACRLYRPHGTLNQFSQPAVARVRGACTPFRARRRLLTRGTLIQTLLEHSDVDSFSVSAAAGPLNPRVSARSLFRICCLSAAAEHAHCNTTLALAQMMSKGADKMARLKVVARWEERN